MYNLIEYRKSYLNTSGSLWNYDKNFSTNPITNFEYFTYKTVLIGKGKTTDNENTKE